MGTTENLNNEDAIKKLKELAESARICMFCTNLDVHPISSRPMSIEEIDDEGNIWFISSSHSNKNEEIKQDAHVQLFFSNTGASEYLSVYGQAYIYTDRATVEEKWTAVANAWFESKDDPEVTVIRVSPLETKYWDTKDGKMITLLKIATSTITGNNKHGVGGVEGELDI